MWHLFSTQIVRREEKDIKIRNSYVPFHATKVFGKLSSMIT